MIPALARFVEALRAEGVAVSPAEIVDASRALGHVGVEDRRVFKSALRATLAKSPRAVASFERLFDAFFVAPRGGSGTGECRPAGSGAGVTGTGRGAAAGARPKPPDPRREPPEEERKRGRAEHDRESRRDRPAESPERRDRPRAAAPPELDDRARALSRALERTRRDGERREGRLRRTRLRAAALPEGPRHRDLARRMTTDEERRVAREVPRLLQELRLRAGRRLEGARTGRPWIRRALRASLGSGGVPFVLPFRRPKRKSSRVVLLVDVSFSVARAAGLFLLMAGEVLELGRRARVIVFVDKPVDATYAIARWARARGKAPAIAPAPVRRGPRRGARPGSGIEARGIAFADVLDGLPELNLDAPSDYGRAFHALYSSKSKPRGRDTILVILGDGRTNRFDPLPWVLQDLARGCRAVLWLVPEPASRWGTADSALPAFLPSVDAVAEATDLDGLARGLGLLMRKL